MEFARLRSASSIAGVRVKPAPKFENLFDLDWIFRCRIRILVVTDSSSGGFGEVTGFHLGQVLKIIVNDQWPHVSFQFTKAHRGSFAGADVLDNFRFDDHDLDQYDEIFLFGIERTGIDPLSASELRELSQFMDNGGGVFATGDHEDLGHPMAAEVPRVRSMRRWAWPSAGPNGEPVAPDQTGLGRLDTLVDDPSTPGFDGDQTDDIPQVVRPRWYTAPSLSPIFGKVVRFPHPVLCGPSGAITHLPDHMHEGLCEVPSDLSQVYTFDGYETAEYPELDGHQEAPQVIAWASNRVNNSEFGVLAAYDGQRSGVGRVVVDATWHHWFNVNLGGFLAASDPANPAFDPASVPAWEEIKSYFRNVAAWLAPAGRQRCMRNGGWLVAIKADEVRMTLRLRDDLKPSLDYYWQLGVFARDALGRLASQCQHRAWIHHIFELIEIEPLLPDPWQLEIPPIPDPPPWIESIDLENIALGGAIHALGAKFAGERELQAIVDERADDIEALARRGAADGVAMLFKGAQDATKLTGKMSKRLEKMR